MGVDEANTSVRVLCRKLLIIKNETGLQWLIGSPFFPPSTIVSTLRCTHTLPSSPLAPHIPKESDDLRALLLRGFEVIGALIVRNNPNFERVAGEAISASRELRKALGRDSEDRELVGGVADLETGDVSFFVSKSENLTNLESVSDVIYEDQPEKYVWEIGCLLRCEVPIKMPVYCPVDSPK
ncbi:Ufm1-specific protease like, partial [Actinidia chinensis var. chinensis]